MSETEQDIVGQGKTAVPVVDIAATPKPVEQPEVSEPVPETEEVGRVQFDGMQEMPRAVPQAVLDILHAFGVELSKLRDEFFAAHEEHVGVVGEQVKELGVQIAAARAEIASHNNPIR